MIRLRGITELNGFEAFDLGFSERDGLELPIAFGDEIRDNLVDGRGVHGWTPLLRCTFKIAVSGGITRG